MLFFGAVVGLYTLLPIGLRYFLFSIVLVVSSNCSTLFSLVSNRLGGFQKFWCLQVVTILSVVLDRRPTFLKFGGTKKHNFSP